MISCLKNIFFNNNDQKVLSFYNAFKPLYIVLSLLGLFPYNIKVKDGEAGYYIIPKSIYFNFLCAVSIVLLMISFMVFHLRLIYESVTDNSLTTGFTTQINYVVELAAIFIFSVITYICIFKNSQKFIKILNNIATNIETPSKSDVEMVNLVKFHVNVVMGTLTLLFFVQICINFTRKDSFLKMIYVVFTFNLPQFIQFTTIGFFYILVISGVIILRNIRKSLIHFGDGKIIVEGIKKVVPKQNYDTLRQAEVVFIDVLDIMGNVNGVFEVPILITLAQCFHSTVSESHIIFYGAGIRHNLGVHDIVNCSVWICYQYLKVYVISFVGNKYKIEVLKLCRAIYKIPTERHDIRFLMEIQNFLSLVSAPSNELTVCGYFSIDSTLFFKMIASTAMYFIILVQFDKTSG